MNNVYIGLGSNLENPEQQVRNAICKLQQLPNTELLVASSLYHTAPIGPQDQPDFINAVAKLRTQLDPFELLRQLNIIESAHNRVRRKKWGPRTLDLDLLLYQEQIIQSENLTVPHPEMHRRAFVLYPLAEIAPDLILPTGETLSQLLQQCSGRVTRLCSIEEN